MPSVDMPEVASITIYPVKSCHYVPVEECEVDNLGIKHDRRFMIINAETNRFVSQRKFASLALLKPILNVSENTLTLTAEGQAPLSLPVTQDLTKLKRRTVKLWQSTMDVYDVGDEAAAWITEFLKNHRQHDRDNNHNMDDPVKADDPVDPVRLVTLDDPRSGIYSRPTHPKLEGIHTAFNDWSPISFGFLSSLEELNKGLLETNFSKGNQIPINRFRHNVTIKGTIPWEEDQWLVAKVGEVTCYIIQPIARCTVPGIDQDTGVKDDWDGKGPSDYLRLTRQFKDEPGEGQFCCDVAPLTSGKIRVGDKIEVLERIPAPYEQRPIKLSKKEA